MAVQDQPILLVEDNDDDAELIAMAFQRSKITNPLVRLRNGVEALNFLLAREEYAENKVRPVIVLLDLGLPGVSGLAVLARIREDERTANLPVVVLTSSGHGEDELFAYDRLVNNYLLKSVDKAEFAATADQVVRRIVKSVERAAALEAKLTATSSAETGKQ
jgi:two-component system, response regulator